MSEEYTFLKLMSELHIMPWDFDKVPVEYVLKLYEYKLAEAEGQQRLDKKQTPIS